VFAINSEITRKTTIFVSFQFSTSLNSGGTEAYDVNTVTYADDSPYMVYSGGDDALCMVWDMRTLNESDPRPVAGLVGHSGGITYIDSKVYD
jgi:WD40 repeat protein